MQLPRLATRRFWITGGIGVALAVCAVVLVSVSEKAQRLAGWLPHVTIDRKARKITLGINLTPPHKGVVLPEAKPITDDLKFLALPPKLESTPR